MKNNALCATCFVIGILFVASVIITSDTAIRAVMCAFMIITIVATAYLHKRKPKTLQKSIKYSLDDFEPSSNDFIICSQSTLDHLRNVQNIDCSSWTKRFVINSKIEFGKILISQGLTTKTEYGYMPKLYKTTQRKTF